MKIALIGGAGLIGSVLTTAYLDAGHDVFVIDKLIYGPQQIIDPRARFYRIDIRDEKLHTILQHERPDLVSHHAVQQHYHVPGEKTLVDADIHIRGLLNILDSCIHSHVKKIVFASGGNSMYEQIDTVQLPAREDTPLKPRCSLDISKLAGEWYIRYYTQRYGLKHTILRYADVYAEHDPIHPPYLYHPLTYFLSMLGERRRPLIRGTGNEIRDHIFIDDIVQANLHALKYGENQTLNISSGQGCSLNQLYHMAADQLSSLLEPIYLRDIQIHASQLTAPLAMILTPLEHACAPVEPAMEPAHRLVESPTVIILDNTQAQRHLNWRPTVSLSEGIRRAARHSQRYREESEKDEQLTGQGELTAV